MSREGGSDPEHEVLMADSGRPSALALRGTVRRQDRRTGCARLMVGGLEPCLLGTIQTLSTAHYLLQCLQSRIQVGGREGFEHVRELHCV